MSPACSADGNPVAIGVDIVEIGAVRRLVSRAARRLGLVFTPEELGKGRPVPARLARIFAAKEAVFKALGRGWGQGVRWDEVLVARRPDGEWSARLRGGAKARFRELGGAALRITAASGRGHAAAVAVVYGPRHGR